MDDLTNELQELASVTQNQDADAIKRVRELINATYKAKAEVDEAEAKFKGLKAELTQVMADAGIEKFEGDDCTATCKLKSNVTVPKDLGAKMQLFDYIKEKHGEDVLKEMLTINARSFTSWYTKEVEAEIQKGNIDFKLEMLKPYEMHSVGFRKKRTK